MTGTTISITLLVIGLIITNATLLIQAKSIRKLIKRITTVEVALLTKAMADMGIETLEDLEAFLREEIEKEE